MGNRAVIALNEFNPNAIGLYLHWNGGRDSVEGFLLAAKHYMDGEKFDKQAGAARLVQVIGTFFEGSLSFYMDQQKNLDLDNWDNGVYVVDTSTMQIIRREYTRGPEQRHHTPAEIADYIDRRLAAASAVEG